MPSSAGHHSPSSTGRPAVGRRGFLKTSLGASAGVLAAPTFASWLSAADAKAATAPLAFVDDYRTNLPANRTPETNAVVRALGGFAQIWKTGGAWNSGAPLRPEILRANMRYCIEVTTRRTPAQAKLAFLYDRQHQSYAASGGLGPLTDLYRTGAKAVTSITSAPDGTPATTIDDAVPADAPAGSALGAGSHDSELGKVAELVDTLRGTWASGNPSKYAYLYPRPWRMNEDSQVVDTGRTDALGYPVYDSKVVVAPQLLRQRSTSPADDGGFPSGHTNAFHLASLAYAYAVPERFQELVTRALELSDTRILAGMHSTVDVIGGRIMATALAAATLADPANADLKAAARAQAVAYFTARTGTNTDTLYAYAHSAGPGTDPYADRDANARAVGPRLTYVLTRHGHSEPLTVPKGAEVLLETRLPYLDAAQRREVLRTTALPSGYVLLDGFEQWGRLNLFAAADGYGGFDRDVTVALDAAAGGFGAADSWRNDIDGDGGLTKKGSGSLHSDRPQQVHRRNRGEGRHAGRRLVPRAGPRRCAGVRRDAAGAASRAGARRVRAGDLRAGADAALGSRTRPQGDPARTAGKRQRAVAAARRAQGADRGQHGARPVGSAPARPVRPRRTELRPAAGRTRLHDGRSVGTTPEAVTPGGGS